MLLPNIKCLLFGRYSQANEIDIHKTLKNPTHTSIFIQMKHKAHELSENDLSDVRLKAYTYWTVETLNSTKINK